MAKALVATTNQQSPSSYPTTVEQWNLLKNQAEVFCRSGLLPSSITRPEQAIVIMLKGRELNMQPMHAFSHINVIKGKPTLSAEGMLALIFRAHPNVKLKYLSNNDKECVIEVARSGNEPSIFKWTIEDAKNAKLLDKAGSGWHTYARAMLRSRCISEMARAMFPDALMGVSYTAEELEDPTPIRVVPETPEETNAQPPKPPASKPFSYDPENDAHTKRLFELLANRQDIMPHLYDDVSAQMAGKSKEHIEDVIKAVIGADRKNASTEMVEINEKLDETF